MRMTRANAPRVKIRIYRISLSAQLALLPINTNPAKPNTDAAGRILKIL